jgi:hypothetical protein
MPEWVIGITVFESFNLAFSVVFWSTLSLAVIVGIGSLLKK